MKLNRVPTTKGIIKLLPDSPGVYIFQNKNAKPIYIGKAKNLKNRVGSYFNLTLGEKTQKMMEESKLFSYLPVDSDLEAILLEAKLIRAHQPYFNSELKDDKSPIYIGITKEKYPRVLTFRQTQLSEAKLKKVYGPFTSAQTTRRVLKILRRVFPFCQAKLAKKTCLYRQIGFCNPCPSEIEQEKNPEIKLQLHKKYLKNIRNLARVLGGDIRKLKSELEVEMKRLSALQKFEEAQEVFNQIQSLELITQAPSVEAYLENPNFLEDVRSREEKQLKEILLPYFSLTKLSRIECFDVAHLAGTFPTASMVTFVNGEPEKQFYRHFKVSIGKTNNDVSSLATVLKRRQKYFETWGKPDLLVVDGGKGQVSGAIEVLGDTTIPIVGIAKRYETLIIKTDEGFSEIRLHGPALRLIQRLRDEAHRFARRYHHTLVSRAMTNGMKKTDK